MGPRSRSTLIPRWLRRRLQGPWRHLTVSLWLISFWNSWARPPPQRSLLLNRLSKVHVCLMCAARLHTSPF
ncbi:hypothetical protein BD309DRAFT_949784 [Dichomitus squalens]|nr:hypothetical protein BD309DRAFT_949784 [Dichomitus squalens]